MKIRHCTVSLLAALLASCGTDSTKSPSFSDRDSYTAADLNMGVVINGG